MGILDKFLSKMKINDDDDYSEDDFLDDDDADFDPDEKPAKRLIRKKKDDDDEDLFAGRDSEASEDEEGSGSKYEFSRRFRDTSKSETADDEEEAYSGRTFAEKKREREKASRSGFAAKASKSSSSASRNEEGTASGGKIAQMRSRKRGEAGMEVCVIRPHSMEDAKEITETLEQGCAVVLNVEGMEIELAQRIIDFASGSCYAIHGNLQKISTYIFIITPASVDISGDFQEILSGAFDVPF